MIPLYCPRCDYYNPLRELLCPCCGHMLGRGAPFGTRTPREKRRTS